MAVVGRQSVVADLRTRTILFLKDDSWNHVLRIGRVQGMGIREALMTTVKLPAVARYGHARELELTNGKTAAAHRRPGKVGRTMVIAAAFKSARK